jgi:hypothetical protein
LFAVPGLLDVPVVILTATGRARYALADADDAPLTVAADGPVHPVLRAYRLVRVRPGQLRHRLEVRDPAGLLLFAVDKPHHLRRQHAPVSGPAGEPVGAVDRTSANPLRPAFRLLGPAGQALADLDHRRPGYGYAVLDPAGAQVAAIEDLTVRERVRPGGRPPAHRYAVRLGAEPPTGLPAGTRMLVVAAAIVADLTVLPG